MQVSPGKSGGMAIDAFERPRVSTPAAREQRSPAAIALSSIAERWRRLRGERATPFSIANRRRRVCAFEPCEYAALPCARILRFPPATVAVSYIYPRTAQWPPGTPWLAREHDCERPARASAAPQPERALARSPAQLRIPAARRRRRDRICGARGASRSAGSHRGRRDVPPRTCARRRARCTDSRA